MHWEGERLDTRNTKQNNDKARLDTEKITSDKTNDKNLRQKQNNTKYITSFRWTSAADVVGSLAPSHSRVADDQALQNGPLGVHYATLTTTNPEMFILLMDSGASGGHVHKS